MLKVENLYVRYGRAVALKGVSIEAKERAITAVVGANGAGKTTLLNAVFNIVAKEGLVIFDKKDITYLKTHKITSMGLGYIPDKRSVFVDMSVYDNLIVAAYTMLKKRPNQWFEEKLEALFEHFPSLKDKLSLKAGYLSGGEQQMLSIAQLVLRQPKMVVMDEPSAGLSPKLTKVMFDLVAFLKKNGIGVLIVEQNVNKTIKISDWVYVLKNGEISDEGLAEEFYDELKLKEAYFGG